MLGLATLDWIVLFGYFVGVTGIGIWAYKKIKNTGDFFMGGRSFGKVLMIFHAFGVGTHTDQPVTVAAASSEIGLAGIWYQWLYLFATPFYWLLAPIYRRLRYVTLGDFSEERYGRSLGLIYAVVGLIYFMFNTGLILKGTGMTIEAITYGNISTNVIILIMTALFVVYGIAGGLVAAVITDFVQGLFIFVLSFLLIPFAINVAGGISVYHRELPEHMFSLVAPTEVTAFFIFMVVINGLVAVVVNPHHMAVCGSGKTEIANRVGWTYGNFMKRIVTLGWAFTGVFAAYLFASELTHENRELAFGLMIKHLLPSGLLGLMIASMMAAVMSTCDAFMVDGAALFTKNFYRKYAKRTSEKRELLIARISSVIIVIGGVSFAIYIPSIVEGLTLLWKLCAFLGIAFWMGIIWKRANRYGAWASIVVTSAIAFYTGDTFSWCLNFPLEYRIAFYLPAGFISLIIVSYLTKPESESQLKKFFTLLHTPVGEEYKLKEQGIEMMLEGEAEPVKDRMGSLEDNGHALLIVDMLNLK